MTNSDKPKYQTLKEYLIDTIRTERLKPGEKINTENELAERFGISRHTVRQAIGELVNEGWLYRVQGSGTFVDRRPDLSGSPSKVIGLIASNLDDYIFPSLIRGIDKVLNGKGYNIFLHCTYNKHEKERMYLENLLELKIDGLIVEPTKSALPNPNIQLYKELSAKGVPVLFINGTYNNLNYSYVVEDDIKAGDLATKHLIELGHLDIGGVFRIDDKQGHNRYEGYQKACREAGLKLNDSSVVWFDIDKMDIGTSNDILKQMMVKSSAIVCHNDQIAVRVADIIKTMGLSIPSDISLVSFDDSSIAVATTPKLTTMAHPKEMLGAKAAECMLQMIDRKVNYFDIKMQPNIVIRDSTSKNIKIKGEYK